MTSTFGRFVLTLAAGLMLAGAAAAAAPKPFLGEEVDLGNPKAPVTVVEYLSASCPHCARFNNNVFPKLKAQYIDNGKVHYILRELLTQPQAFAAAGFLTARCKGKEHYVAALDTLYHQFDSIKKSSDMLAAIQKSGKAIGLNPKQVDACITSKPALAALQKRVEAAEKAGVDGTPTFFVNGTKLETGGEPSLGDLMLALEPALAKAAASEH